MCAQGSEKAWNQLPVHASKMATSESGDNVFGNESEDLAGHEELPRGSEKDVIEYYFYRSLTYRHLTLMLERHHNVAISERTLKRRLKDYCLSRRGWRFEGTRQRHHTAWSMYWSWKSQWLQNNVARVTSEAPHQCSSAFGWVASQRGWSKGSGAEEAPMPQTQNVRLTRAEFLLAHRWLWQTEAIRLFHSWLCRWLQPKNSVARGAAFQQKSTTDGEPFLAICWSCTRMPLACIHWSWHWKWNHCRMQCYLWADGSLGIRPTSTCPAHEING